MRSEAGEGLRQGLHDLRWWFAFTAIVVLGTLALAQLGVIQ